MRDRARLASLSIAIGSVLCFFLPFATVSCQGMKAFTFTGQQLATGTTVSQPQVLGPPSTQRVSADPFAAIAGLCALAGVAFILVGRKMSAPCSFAEGAGALSLLIMRSRFNSQIATQSQGLATVNYEWGFLAAVTLLLVGAAWNAYLLVQRKSQRKLELSGDPTLRETTDLSPPGT